MKHSNYLTRCRESAGEMRAQAGPRQVPGIAVVAWDGALGLSCEFLWLAWAVRGELSARGRVQLGALMRLALSGRWRALGVTWSRTLAGLISVF